MWDEPSKQDPKLGIGLPMFDTEHLKPYRFDQNIALIVLTRSFPWIESFCFLLGIDGSQKMKTFSTVLFHEPI